MYCNMSLSPMSVLDINLHFSQLHLSRSIALHDLLKHHRFLAITTTLQALSQSSSQSLTRVAIHCNHILSSAKHWSSYSHPQVWIRAYTVSQILCWLHIMWQGSKRLPRFDFAISPSRLLELTLATICGMSTTPPDWATRGHRLRRVKLCTVVRCRLLTIVFEYLYL